MEEISLRWTNYKTFNTALKTVMEEINVRYPNYKTFNTVLKKNYGGN